MAEAHGITPINTYVMDDNTAIWNHWKRGGKMKRFAEVRLDASDGYSQITKAVDKGAAGVHVNGDAAEALLRTDRFERIGEMVQLIKAKKRIAGVAAHDLRVIVECVKANLDVDFYQKTLHTHDYYTAPRPEETAHAQEKGFSTEDLHNADLELLSAPEEMRIIRKLLIYPMMFEGAVIAHEPHRITFYLQELSGLFHPYYNKYRVIDSDRELSKARLALCEAVRIILRDGLTILGISTPEKM